MTDYRWTCEQPLSSDMPPIAELLAAGWEVVGIHPAWKDLILVKRTTTGG